MGQIPKLDVNTATMIIPASIASDGDYLYVAHGDKGPDAKVRAEVSVYSLSDGRKIGWIIPGAETTTSPGRLTSRDAGAQAQDDGSCVIAVVENGGGKAWFATGGPDATT
ncbi:MAG: hypothetical protein IPL70_08765 [Uliginosibacterium sp.]|nr:hypothetical protein [Uliginosibacterium sp.]